MHHDPGDPVQRVIDREQARDHANAKARGERVRGLVDLLVAALDGYALIRDVEQARPILCATLAEGLYGLRAVDLDTRAPGDRRP